MRANVLWFWGKPFTWTSPVILPADQDHNRLTQFKKCWILTFMRVTLRTEESAVQWLVMKSPSLLTDSQSTKAYIPTKSRQVLAFEHLKNSNQLLMISTRKPSGVHDHYRLLTCFAARKNVHECCLSGTCRHHSSNQVAGEMTCNGVICMQILLDDKLRSLRFPRLGLQVQHHMLPANAVNTRFSM